VAGFPD
ncbi:conjugal transfer protein TraF, partial [Escherichia coli]